MGASLISKLKPNYFDKSKIESGILIVKRLNCFSYKANLTPLNLKYFKKVIQKFTKTSKGKSISKEIFAMLEWRDGLSVLVISFNGLKDLDCIQKCNIETLDIVGVDLSLKRLKIISKLYKGKLDLSLVECCVQDLPFLDNIFDMVVNIGSFNNYQDRTKAIKEMQRVAKEGSSILIADTIDSNYQKVKSSLDIKNPVKGSVGECYYFILQK